MRIGFLGGTFNPIHYGHLRAAEEVRERLGLERVLFIPAHQPPLKSQDVAPASARLHMCRLALEGRREFLASTIELERPDVSYTADTVDALRALYPEASLVFIIGIDAFSDLHLWKDTERLLSGTDVAIVSRPGAAFMRLHASPFLRLNSSDALAALDRGEGSMAEALLHSGRRAWLIRITGLDISSTRIRQRVRQGQSISYLLPEKVESFIMSEGLYAQGPAEQG